jgi:competence protein ComEC
MRAPLLTFLLLSTAAASLQAQRPEGKLDIFYIDTEGGQATLFVGPTGESLLVDTGNAGERDLGRIVDTLAFAGVSQIDHLWTTHYHGDHVGSLLALADQIPVMHFYDHGAPHENDRIVPAQFLVDYERLSQGRRTIMQPGDKLPMPGVDITTVVSDGAVIVSSLPGGGIGNAACSEAVPVDESGYFDPDNGASAGFVLTFGEFRTVDLGDLTWNGELELMCPTNPIGHVDLYLTSHHGLAQSGSPALVHGLAPRVAVMNNGTRKGGAPEAFAVLHASPGLEDLWQLHWSHNARLENSPASFIANLDDTATIADVLTAEPAAAGARGGFGSGPGARGGFGGGAGRRGGFPGGGFGGGAAAHEPAFLIHVSAEADGSFTVTNSRNGFSKAYAAKP